MVTLLVSKEVGQWNKEESAAGVRIGKQRRNLLRCQGNPERRGSAHYFTTLRRSLCTKTSTCTHLTLFATALVPLR